ncbi:MAG: 3-hydroxyacyl-ACP dehydratase FabZ [Propionibacteriaceae bacterium]|jgi:3-hydroxyacyl-[acyl-carrier-protein] dehydratase|nr:3-hydroxyacyl-ACP dehydratase FabZ [Propionibacteriaceae bacterium]
MNREEIKGVLPHREPMLLVDEAHRESDESVGSYTVRGDEYFLQGHFPGNPVVPGVILCEMMAQSGCVLFSDALAGKTPYFSGLDKVRFKRTVVPGDTVVFRCRVTATKGPFYFLSGTGYVADEVCVTAEMSFALVI